MGNRSIGFRALAMGFLACLSVPWALGDEPKSTFELVLEAAVAQQVFAVGEPVVIDLKLTNVGGKELSIFEDLAATAGTVRFEISRPSGDVVKYVPSVMRDPARRKMVRPGEALAGIQDLSLLRGPWPSGALTFREPGRYKVTVFYDGFLPPDVARPQPATVDVVVQKPADGDPFEVFRDPVVLRFTAGEGHDPKAADKLREQLGGSKAGPVEPYLEYFLGADCVDVHEHSQSADRLEALQKCVALLDSAAGRDFQLKDMALLALARAEKAMGNQESARKHAGMAVATSRRLYVKKRATRVLETAGDSGTRPPPRS